MMVNPMPEQNVKISDVIKVLWSYRWSMAFLFFAVFGLVMAVYASLPRVYLADMTIHMSGNYFQNPLLGDLVSQVYDPSELREERAKIIRSSLSEQFAEAADDKYHLFSTSPDSPDRALEVEAFLKGIDIISITATQFKIRVKAPGAEIAYGLTQDAISAIRERMYQRRAKMLQDLLDILSNEIEHASSEILGDERGKMPPSTGVEAAKAQVAAKIEAVSARLTALRTTYNDQHPAVQKVKTELARLHAASQGRIITETARSDRLGADKSDQIAASATKDELKKRRHMVNMSFEMEKKDPTMSAYLSIIEDPKYPRSPNFPKLRIFLIVGLVAALLASLFPPALGEYRRRMRLSPFQLTKNLGIEILGVISPPTLSAQKSQVDSGRA